MASHSVWDEFPLDPRSAQNGALRASDGDREVVHRVLGDAYADGRLTREEFDQRNEAVLRARTLSELPALILDLTPPAAPQDLVAATSAQDLELEARAVAAYRSDRREAAWAFLSASIVCWVIWWVTSGGAGFPWPVFVSIGTGLHLLRLVVMRSSEIEARRTRLEREPGARAVEDRERPELGRGGDDA